MRRTLVVVIALLAGVVACASLPGCESGPSRDDLVQAANEAGAYAELAMLHADAWRAEVERMESDPNADPEAIAKVKSQLDVWTRVLAEAALAAQQLEQDLAALDENAISGEVVLTGAGSALQSASRSLPPPIGTWVWLAGAGLTGIGALVGKLGLKRPNDLPPAEVTALTNKAWDEAYREGERAGRALGLAEAASKADSARKAAAEAKAAG